MKAKKAKEPKAAPVPALEIQQGYGLRAHLDEPYLFIAQDDGEGKTDTLCLSRAEVRQIIEKFSAWAA